MKLYNIAKNLILETASRNNIMKCVSDRRIAEVYYDDDEDPGGEGRRWIEIVCYGSLKVTILQEVIQVLVNKRQNL